MSESLSSEIAVPSETRTLAIVSGKGGSGKTLVATTVGHGLALCGRRVLLIDADTGTGGLSYYLGFTSYSQTREGLAEFILNKLDRPNISAARAESVLSDGAFARIDLLPIGDHRTFHESQSTSISDAAIGELIKTLSRRGAYDYIIFDCRGGIDDESLSVCRCVQNILIVVETDAASIQSSQHLSNVLGASKVARKVLGFALNKVMDDPTTLAQAGRTFFKADYLGAIPFDIETTRRFIKGQVPESSSLFSNHVYRIVAQMYPQADELNKYPVLDNYEFSTVTLKSPDLRAGNTLFLIVLLFVFAVGMVAMQSMGISVVEKMLFAAVFAISLLAQVDGLKQSVGYLIRQTIAKGDAQAKKSVSHSPDK